MSEEATLVARQRDGEGETTQRPITAEYDPSCKLIQFVQYGEEVFGTLEPIEPEEWQEIVDRLGQAAPFMRRVLVLVQEVERIAADLGKQTPAGARQLGDELRGATARFAGSIDPEAVVKVAHAADVPEEDEPHREAGQVHRGGSINLVPREMCDECDAFLGKAHRDGCSKGDRAVIEADTTEKFTTVAHVEQEEPLIGLDADTVQMILDHLSTRSTDDDFEKTESMREGLELFVAASRELEGQS